MTAPANPRTFSVPRSVILSSLAIAAAVFGSGCGVLQKKEVPEQPIPGVNTAPLSTEESKELMSQMGTDWLYGPGMGDTAVTLGSIVVFPPLALYHLGNAALGVGGYEPLGVSTVLPEKERGWWRRQYDSVVSIPGRIAAATAGREYRRRDVIEEWNREFFEKHARESAVVAAADTAQNRTEPVSPRLFVGEQ